MSYKIDSNNKDPLAELFRQKLENHRVAVDSNGWSELNKSLGGNRKRTLWMVVSAISAAVIAMLFILSPSDKDPIDTPLQGESTTTINHQNDEAVADDVSIVPQKEKGQIAQPGSKVVAVNAVTSSFTASSSELDKQTSAIDKKEFEQKPQTNTTTSKVEHKEEEEKEANVKSDYIAVADVTTPKPEKEEQKQAEEKQVYANNSLLFDFEEEETKKSEKKNWTIAAVYGGSTSGNENINGAQVPMRMSPSLDKEANSNLFAQTAVKEWGEGSHFPEMSFSFKVGKKISKRLAVETGVTYTYLYSKFDGAKNTFSIEKKQHLHYIGIPVNVAVYVFDGSSKWNLYASGGVMLEKGIRATIKETVAGDAMGQESESYSESISGVQWSINASVGASYDLSRNFSLFLAPRLSYYFDNNQPESIRTNKDISFGLNIGLKYNL